MRLASRTLLAFTALVCSACAYANAGTTSAGVTTTDPNAPSTDVQQQSSGFVTANQQLQNGGANGIALPAGVAGVTQPGQSGAGDAGATSGPAEGGKDAAAEHEAPAVPAAPPPPPPTYESKIRPLNALVDVPPAQEAPAPPVHTPLHAPKKPAGRPTMKPVVVPTANPSHAPPAEKKQDQPTPTVAADPGGGRGEGSDGYTFWLGLVVAGALLVLALTAYLRIRRGESPH